MMTSTADPGSPHPEPHRRRMVRGLSVATLIAALAPVWLAPVAWPAATRARARAAAHLPPGARKCPNTECDYIYDPAVGDSAAGIPPGTAFRDLPDDWMCPDCGTEKALW